MKLDQTDSQPSGNSADHRQDEGRHGENPQHPEHPPHPAHPEHPDTPRGKPVPPPPVHGGHSVPPPLREGGPRLEASATAMQAWPQFKFEQRDGFGEWTGLVQPIRSAGTLGLILDDLLNNRTVYVADGGEVLHWAECPARHRQHAWAGLVHNPCLDFAITVRYGGGPAVPRAYIDSPHLDPKETPHMWSDGSICAFNAADNVWQWERHTVTDFLRYVSIWLVKWIVFSQARIWIGAQHVGNPDHHLVLIPPSAQCWCGSGIPYGLCHRPRELALVAARQKAPRSRAVR